MAKYKIETTGGAYLIETEDTQYPRIEQGKQALEAGLGGAVRGLTEQFQRNIIPGVAPEVSQDVLRQGPGATLGKLATGYGATQFPLSTLGAFLTRKGLETPIGKAGIAKSQELLQKVPRQLPNEPMMGALQTAGQIARTLSPEQFAPIPKMAAEAGVFAGLSRIDRPLTQLGEKLPSFMGKGYKLQRAKQLAKDAEDIKNGIGSQIREELNKLSPSGGATQGNLYIDTGIDNDIKTLLPKNTIEKLKDPIYGVKWIGGKIEKTVENIHRFRQALADQMTGGDWNEATSQLKGNIGRMFMVSGDYMKKKVPNLAPLFDEYSGYIKDVYEPAVKVLYSGEQVMERPIRAVLRKGGEEGKQPAFEALGAMSKTAQRAIRDLEKYAGRAATQMWLKKGLSQVPRGAGLVLGGSAALGGLYGLGRAAGLLPKRKSSGY